MFKKVVFTISILLSVSISHGQKWLDAFKDGAYAYKQGDYEVAIKHFSKALPLVKKEAGQNTEDYAIVLGSMGQSYNKLLNYSKAEEYLMQSITIYKNYIGIDSKFYANYTYTLALLYKETSKFELAEFYCMETIESYRKLYPQSQDLCYILNSVAMFLLERHQLEKAEMLFSEALGITKKNMGLEHEETATILFNLGTLYTEMAQYDKAESVLTDAMIVRKKLFGKTSTEYSYALNNLAVVYEVRTI